MTGEEPILDWAMNGSNEAAQRIGASRNALRASGLVE